ncbi:MAG: electron-transfer flavoprotein:ubiquinone oxidoreductase [Elusimicrobiota bacterium]|jgi:electron-transferring-flavoprotein dehydrogenase
MSATADMDRVDALVVGAGPAGLAAAIALKKKRPELSVCVVDKAGELGQHNLSGAVLEAGPLEGLLDLAAPGWRDTAPASEVLGRRVEQDDLLMFLGGRHSLSLNLLVELGGRLGLSLGAMRHKGDAIVSISKLTRWLGSVAGSVGVEVLTGFGVERVTPGQPGEPGLVKFVDQGRDREGREQLNFLAGDTVAARFVILAEGCDGAVTEELVRTLPLQRATPQVFSVGIKEVIHVSSQQYKGFGDKRVVHSLGYPLWTPLLGPSMFGGGLMYSYGQDQIAVGMIVGADWIYRDFNPEDALALWKRHPAVQRYIAGGQTVAAGAKMIPEGGCRAWPRDPATGSIGRGNVLIVGDSAGFVDMHSIKGLHNGVLSGLLAAEAVASCLERPNDAAAEYTRGVEESVVGARLRAASNFRQIIARLGPTLGAALSPWARWLPALITEPDYEAMTSRTYPGKPEPAFDKDAFTALAESWHREDQPGHLEIIDPEICRNICRPKFDQPCRIFCPAGVYDHVQGEVKAANPSNCVHCKTCQRKCPLDNIRWHVPEGGGPRYKMM